MRDAGDNARLGGQGGWTRRKSAPFGPMRRHRSLLIRSIAEPVRVGRRGDRILEEGEGGEAVAELVVSLDSGGSSGSDALGDREDQARHFERAAGLT